MAQLTRVDRFLDRKPVWIAFVGLVLTVQAALVLTHQPWLDEWQALQISLQSPDLPALLENLRYEGHPPVWYLLLRSAAHFTRPEWVLAAVQLPVALAIQSLVLFRLPFSRLERLLVASNPYLLIDYGAISRSLGLGVLLAIVAVLYRERRWAWLAIAFLPLMDFLFGVLSIIFVALFYREKRLWAPGLILWLLCAIAAAWSVRPAPDVIPALWLHGPGPDALDALTRFGALLLPLSFSEGQVVWNATPPFIPALLAGILFIAMGLWLLRGDRVAQFLFGSFVALIFIFSISVYPLAIRHVSLALVLLLALLAVGTRPSGRNERIFKLWLGVGAACGAIVTIANLTRPFDSAQQAARFIVRNHLESKHWASFPDSRAQGVSALTGVEFERLERDCTESFIRWNYRTKIETPADLERELGRIAARGGSFYLLTDRNLLGEPLGYPTAFRQLYHVPAGVDGQDFYLYQVRPDLGEDAAPVPPCPPRRLPLRLLRND